jgi:hypothetical protein
LGRASTTAHNFMNYLKLKLISSELLFIFWPLTASNINMLCNNMTDSPWRFYQL